ncbi:MAG: hypothetical protein CSB32_00395 [Desulfobacterales bacterium]|nr:MAG: hypothetical protein CSB32_00395 [Desulfobacterales bacterium]
MKAADQSQPVRIGKEGVPQCGTPSFLSVRRMQTGILPGILDFSVKITYNSHCSGCRSCHFGSIGRFRRRGNVPPGLAEEV